MTNEEAISLLEDQMNFNRTMQRGWGNSMIETDAGNIVDGALYANQHKDVADALELAINALRAGGKGMNVPSYDLDRLRELVEADRDSRCVVFFAKPGKEVWVVERDEIGKPDCVSGFVFMAEVGGFAIVHPFLGECGDIDEILNHCEEETARNYSCDVSVFPVADCYESYEAAEEALKGGEKNG